MRIHKKNKPTLRRPDVRSLTIQSKLRYRQRFALEVPEIRFNGKWLYDLGFAPGARVTVISKPGLLIIQPQE